ncbi:MAG: hypothetical protein KKD63_13310 [Proteobacteria bacterium]|nr:hypothetical protein [Desulfobulbaceae bacterium]MBU4153846.1 hypothetical protein [Pseudomonadota bacterium]
MSKHYHICLIAFISVLAVGLTVSITPQIESFGQGFSLGVTTVLADDDDHRYGSDGYDEDDRDREGRDRDGYDHEGYSKDGYRRDRSYHKDRDHRRREKTKTTGTSGSEQPFVVKPKVNQY